MPRARRMRQGSFAWAFLVVFFWRPRLKRLWQHVLNAQVSLRAPCCKTWHDCRQCHDEKQGHPLQQKWELVFGCKKCKHVFRKDMRDFDEETDAFCPKCDNMFFIEARTPQLSVGVSLEGDAGLVRDDRERQRHAPTSTAQ